MHKFTKLGLSMAAVAGIAAPVAGLGVMADVAPAAAACNSEFSGAHEIPLMFFGQQVGTTKVVMRWQDSNCNGTIDHVSATTSSTTNPGTTFCGVDPPFPSSSWEGNLPPYNGFYGNGYYFNYNFKHSFLGGPCTVTNGMHVEGYLPGIGGHALFTWYDSYGFGTKEVS